MKALSLVVCVLFLIYSNLMALGAEKKPFTPLSKDQGNRISTVNEYKSKGASPSTLYCSGSCGGGPTYHWQCGDNEHCGINCAAKPPYAYCYVE